LFLPIKIPSSKNIPHKYNTLPTTSKVFPRDTCLMESIQAKKSEQCRYTVLRERSNPNDQNTRMSSQVPQVPLAEQETLSRFGRQRSVFQSATTAAAPPRTFSHPKYCSARRRGSIRYCRSTQGLQDLRLSINDPAE
jgi:hypothetical protein